MEPTASSSPTPPPVDATSPSRETPSLAGPIDPTGAEWRSILPWLLLFCVLGAVPAVLARIDLPSIVAFTERPAGNTAVYPSILAAEDYPQYRAAIRDAAESGRLASHNHFTTEPHDPVIQRPFYSILGWISGRLGIGPLAAYLLAGLLSRVFLLVALYRFAALVFAERRERLLAFLLAIVVSGLGGWASLLQGDLPPALVARYSEGFERTEYNTFAVLFHHPHLIAGLALILVMARSIVRIVVEVTAARVAMLFVWMLALSLTNFFSLVPLGASTAALLGVLFLLRRRGGEALPDVTYSTMTALAIGGAGGLPFLLYALAVFRGDPFWSATYGTATGQSSPAPDVVAFHLLVLVIPAIFGLLPFLAGAASPSGDREARTRATARWLTIAWIATAAILMYFPWFDFQIRAAFGIQPFLAMIAAAGILAFGRALGSAVANGVVGVAFCLVALVTPFVWVKMLAVDSVRGDTELYYRLLYRPDAEVEAAEWLARECGPDEAVLCGYESGNYLAGRIRGRVFVGHDSGTLDCARKLEEIQRFFGGGMTPEEGARFLQEAGVDFIFFGPFELRRFGQWDYPSLGERVELVHQTAGAYVFRVQQP